MDKNIESTYGAHIPSLHAKKTYASAQNECHKLHLRMTNITRTEMSPKTLMKAHSPKAGAHMFLDWAPISNAVVHTFNSSHSDSNQGEIYGGDAADRAGHFVGQYFGFALGCGFEAWPGAMSQFFKIFWKSTTHELHHHRVVLERTMAGTGCVLEMSWFQFFWNQNQNHNLTNSQNCQKLILFFLNQFYLKNRFFDQNRI